MTELKLLQNSKTKIVTNFKKSNFNEKSKGDKTQKLKLSQNFKTQIVTKLKNSNCDKTKNSVCDKTQNFIT